MDEDDLIRPWFDHIVGGTLDEPLFDIHTHTGFNDPDGFKSAPEAVTTTLAAAGSRGMVMPMHEPDGYPPANDRVLREAEGSNGRLVAFCRLDPKEAPVTEARRCVDSGARGIKLHPRAEGFDLADPAVDEIFAFAHERRLPILIHAGRGIPALALHALMLAQKYPDARVILAHGALTDLSWVWRELPACPNVFIDSSTWSSSDLTALLALVPPGQILYGSDLPYFTPFLVATLVMRCGLHVGLSPEQLACIMGGQSDRLIRGEDPIDAGPPPGRQQFASDVLLERVYTLLVMAVGRMVVGETGYEPLALARLGCELGGADTTEGQAAQHVLAILDRQERFAREQGSDSGPFYPGVRLIMLAAGITSTPEVALPANPDLTTTASIRGASMAGHRASEAADLPGPVVRHGDLRRSSMADHMVGDPSPLGPPEEGGAR
jgi:predicted TIM-barrel fold metal-dependent hydrolase